MFKINDEKPKVVEIEGKKYERWAVQTPVLVKDDSILEAVKTHAVPEMKEGDIILISEKALACTQSRAIPLDEIHPRPLAKFLSKYVTKSPHGIGLSMPETMEMALVECGTVRIIFAAFVSAIGKIFGQKGIFYVIAGPKAKSIDGPCWYTIEPYNHYVVLGPENPEQAAKSIKEETGYDAAIIDANDLGIDILGCSGKLDETLIKKIWKDNPLGQAGQSTPFGVIRIAE